MARSEKMLSQTDCYLFGLGRHYEIYEKLGAHAMTVDGQDGVYFAVWAPNAKAVNVVGEFNNWEFSDSLEPVETSGIWDGFIPDAKIGQMYKFAIHTYNGRVLFKADPYANQSEYRPGTASVIADLSYEWSDRSWMSKRKKRDMTKEPMSIYEVHPGSWRKRFDSTHEWFYNYRELADELVDYIKKMGYTHVELMGIAEHPFDGSWGYQVTGYYSPTSRYGSPTDFMYFIDKMHNNGIGVILDWVPAHFPRDAHGLAEFDGTPTYEYADPRKGEHPDWGTKIFDYGRNEVINFLLANALFWIEKFHIDGLRVDAVASMLYLDYGKTPGNWVPNIYGGHENLEAIEFFKHLNSMLMKRNPGVMMIAEESTAWPLVTRPPEDGGLGFTFKWNMGWMHDFLEYMQMDPIYRKYHHNKMTFSMTYAFSENYILVLSHDEVVHLKKSMLSKMPGWDGDKFRQLKTAYTFMMGHPGKKLLFMGQDFGQWAEWNEAKALDWYLLGDERHRNLQAYVSDILKVYKKYSSGFELDQSWEGFQWINADDADNSVFSFIRRNKKRKNSLIYVCSFTPVERKGYRIGVPENRKYQIILDNDHGYYKKEERTVLKPQKVEFNGMPYSLELDLQGYGACILKFDED